MVAARGTQQLEGNPVRLGAKTESMRGKGNFLAWTRDPPLLKGPIYGATFRTHFGPSDAPLKLKIIVLYYSTARENFFLFMSDQAPVTRGVW